MQIIIRLPRKSSDFSFLELIYFICGSDFFNKFRKPLNIRYKRGYLLKFIWRFLRDLFKVISGSETFFFLIEFFLMKKFNKESRITVSAREICATLEITAQSFYKMFFPEFSEM